MKVTFLSEHLQKVLRDVVRVVPNSTTRPVLRFVLIEANREQQLARICASSEDMSVERRVIQTVAESPVRIEESGTCLLPARELLEIVKRSNQEVTLTQVENTRVKITFGHTRFELAGLDPTLFTPYDEKDTSNMTAATLTAPELHRLLRRTTYAVYRGNARPILTGVHLTLSESGLTGMATDGLRLAMETVPCTTVQGETRSLAVPGLLLDKLAVTLPAHDDDESVGVTIGSRSILVTWDDDCTRVVMRGLDGTFPDTSRIIPERTKVTVVLNRETLLRACERVSILSETENQRAEFAFAPESLTVSVVSNQFGNAMDRMDVESATPETDLCLWCNVHYWVQLLRSFDGAESIEVGINGVNTPCTVKPAGSESLALIAPLLQASKAPSKEERESA